MTCGKVAFQKPRSSRLSWLLCSIGDYSPAFERWWTDVGGI